MFSSIAPTTKDNACHAIGIPQTWQGSLQLDDASDPVSNPFVLTGNEIESLFNTLSIYTDGCDDAIVRVEYVDTGAKCDVCTPPNDPAVEYRYYYVAACTSRTFSNGLWADVDITFLDSASWTNDPAADFASGAAPTQDVTVGLYADRQVNKCCPLPEVTNTRGATIAAEIFKSKG